MRIRGNLGYPAGVTVAAAALMATGHAAALADTIQIEVHHESFLVVTGVPGQGTAHGTVEVGDVVQWTWVSDLHSVTSDTGLFDSGIHDSGFMFQHTFNDPGTYPYYCIVHGAPGGLGMAGSITVVPAPGAIAAIGVAGLFAARRRRR